MAKYTVNKAPQVRTRGFDDDWAEKPIGKILSEVNRSIVLNDDQSYELVTVKRRNEGIISRGNLLGRDILVKNYFQLETRDFVISKRQVVHGATGVVPESLDKAIVSNEYLVAAGNDDISTEFLALISRLPNMKRKYFLSSYGVDIEKLFFDAEDWKSRTVTIPNLDEQYAIGAFFEKLDLQIQSFQSRYDKLLALKQSMLQKIFCQEGNEAPQVRLKGFESRWEPKRLEELGEFNPKTLVPDEFEYVDLESVVGTQIISHRRIKKIDAPSRAQRVAQCGDIFFQTVRPYQKNNHLFSLPDKNFVFSTGYAQIRPFKDGAFLLALVQHPDFVKTVLRNCTGTSYPAINSTALSQIVVWTPTSCSEQKKIGTYFRHFDTLISLQTIQIAKLKQIKSACLEKMFV